MASVKHAKQTLLADDPTKGDVLASHWNAEHVVSVAYGDLSDAATVNLPTVNTPLQSALDGKQATLAVTNKQVVYGTGTSIGSSSGFVYDAASGRAGFGTANPGGVVEIVKAGNSAGVTYGYKATVNGGSNYTNVAGFFSAANNTVNLALELVGDVYMTAGTGSLRMNGNAISGAGNTQFRGIADLTNVGNLLVGDTTAFNVAGAPHGGYLVFGGDDRGQAQAFPFAAVRGLKDNGTYLNRQGALAFYTQSDTFTGDATSNLSTMVEWMRIISAGNIGMGTPTPSAKAALDITSTTRGFLPPRMTTTQRDAITAVPAGLMVYNTTLGKLNFYNGTAWETVTSL